MSGEVLLVLRVVVSGDPAQARPGLFDLRGRELPGVPGSLVTAVAYRPLPLHEEEPPAPRDDYERELNGPEREHEHSLDFERYTEDESDIGDQ